MSGPVIVLKRRHLKRGRHKLGPVFSLWMTCQKITSTISFAEIVKGRDANVRMTNDRLLYAVDLAVVGTGKSRNYAGQVISNSRKNRELKNWFTRNS